ncbi:hypothetical protein PISMIDRAFT_424907 [Pisolithus microcarpus 441]|uniref:Unplaced genomic scaffold scaffold_369, whole genome shotgun sequence n=1 Tax=Pisolithus microcarpus 441 TaxID=765257 RepID=A0A0C9YQS7_9AGAM|nr:hypothetical protein BKA83DRAFT_424907 [Pisolithus microcarpus]KIK12722.1 hypothetical protein PISMIDRAFT_424907 [Pisolithus microcarpus 441]
MSFPLAYTRGNGVGAMESIITSYSRTTALGITPLLFACTLYSYMSALNMVMLSLYPLRPSNRRAAYLLPLVEHDGGADTRSFTTNLAQLRLRTQRASPCSWDME